LIFVCQNIFACLCSLICFIDHCYFGMEESEVGWSDVVGDVGGCGAEEGI